jgi:hypothetical protein
MTDLAQQLFDDATALNRSCADQSVKRRNVESAADDLLAACELQHHALDLLLAELISRDADFMPTKSPAWPAVVAGHAAIAKARGEAP